MMFTSSLIGSRAAKDSAGAAGEAAPQKAAGANIGGGPDRVRQDFPETLLWQPALITDGGSPLVVHQDGNLYYVASGEHLTPGGHEVIRLTPDGKRIAGYYTLSQYSIDLSVIPKEISRQFPKYPVVPATLIGRLAVSKEFRGQGLGQLLLMDALKRSLDSSKAVASAAVIVDAKDDDAATFYRKYGFLELPKVPRRRFLPMATVEKIFE